MCALLNKVKEGLTDFKIFFLEWRYLCSSATKGINNTEIGIGIGYRPSCYLRHRFGLRVSQRMLLSVLSHAVICVWLHVLWIPKVNWLKRCAPHRPWGAGNGLGLHTHTYTSKNTTYSFMGTAYFREKSVGGGGDLLRHCWAVGPTQGGPDDHDFVCVCSRAYISFHMGFYDFFVCLFFNDTHTSTICILSLPHLFVFYATVGHVCSWLYVSLSDVSWGLCLHCPGTSVPMFSSYICSCVCVRVCVWGFMRRPCWPNRWPRLLLTDDKWQRQEQITLQEFFALENSGGEHSQTPRWPDTHCSLCPVCFLCPALSLSLF